MDDYIICDTHCDTASEALDKNFSLFDNSLHIDLRRMSKYKHYTQFFAAFISPDYYGDPIKRCIDIIDYIYTQAELCQDKIKICKNISDIEYCKENNLNSAILSVEGGEAAEDIAVLKMLHRLGVRMFSLTWNNDNNLGGGVLGDGRGLSPLGVRAVDFMNDGKMIVDLSHANEKTFYEVMDITRKPVVLSHSDSYSLCPNPRNITDRQFEEVMRTGSVVGINFYPLFLTGKETASVYDIANHIEHFLSLGGEDNICIGSDFDGIDLLPDGICGIENIGLIFTELSKRGYSDEILQKIAYKNIYRVISICL